MTEQLNHKNSLTKRSPLLEMVDHLRKAYLCPMGSFSVFISFTFKTYISPALSVGPMHVCKALLFFFFLNFICDLAFNIRNIPLHWDDPGGWNGEGSGWGVPDGEHMYTHG